MNKGEFLKSIATKANFTAKEANAAYDAFVDTVVEALKAGDKIQLVGFGSFELKTKAKVKIPASKAPVMKFGKSFKDLFN